MDNNKSIGHYNIQLPLLKILKTNVSPYGGPEGSHIQIKNVAAN